MLLLPMCNYANDSTKVDIYTTLHVVVVVVLPQENIVHHSNPTTNYDIDYS